MREREKERERQTDRDTDRDRERERLFVEMGKSGQLCRSTGRRSL